MASNARPSRHLAIKSRRLASDKAPKGGAGSERLKPAPTYGYFAVRVIDEDQLGLFAVQQNGHGAGARVFI